MGSEALPVNRPDLFMGAGYGAPVSRGRSPASSSGDESDKTMTVATGTHRRKSGKFVGTGAICYGLYESNSNRHELFSHGIRIKNVSHTE